jgi:hypothetical protein
MKKSFFLKTVFLAVSLSVSGACSDDGREQSYTCLIGTGRLGISGPSNNLPPMGGSEELYESGFTLTGSAQECDAKATVQFNAAMLALQSFVNSITGYSGTAEYILSRGSIAPATKDILFTPNLNG